MTDACRVASQDTANRTMATWPKIQTFVSRATNSSNYFRTALDSAVFDDGSTILRRSDVGRSRVTSETLAYFAVAQHREVLLHPHVARHYICELSSSCFLVSVPDVVLCWSLCWFCLCCVGVVFFLSLFLLCSWCVVFLPSLCFGRHRPM